MEILFYNPGADWEVSFVLTITFGIAVMSLRWGWLSIIETLVFGLLIHFLPVLICSSFAIVIAIAFMIHQVQNDSGFSGALYPINPSHQISEIDVNGTVIAYRYFGRNEDGTLTSVGTGMVVDGGTYPGGYKRSDRVPTLKNENGIYAAKTPDSPILHDYSGHGNVLAQVRLSGRIVEGEYGYRAQYCEIVKTLE